MWPLVAFGRAQPSPASDTSEHLAGPKHLTAGLGPDHRWSATGVVTSGFPSITLCSLGVTNINNHASLQAKAGMK